MKNLFFSVVLLSFMTSVSLSAQAQNRVNTDKYGNIVKNSTRKNSTPPVDISKILKPETDKTNKTRHEPKNPPREKSGNTNSVRENSLKENQINIPRETESDNPMNNNLSDDGFVPQEISNPSWDDIDEYPEGENPEELKEFIRNLVINSFEQDMVNVDGGTYMMGKTKEQGKEANKNEQPKHNVTVASFKISKYEVTQAQWLAIMGTNPSTDQDDLGKPVTNVSYRDIMEFIQKLNEVTGLHFRLPTEQEWEFAARGGNRVHGNKYYKYAGADNPIESAWTNWNSNRSIHRVGELYPNELGLYDMSGNVMEWCADRFQYYDKKQADRDYSFYSGDNYVCRGGSAMDDPSFCRVSSRMSVSENEAKNYLGFRLAM